MRKSKIEVRGDFFDETSHTPALIDIVGEEKVAEVIDFCFIENPHFPDEELLWKLSEKLPMLIKSYPSSNSIVAQKHLGLFLGVNPKYLILGNGSTELISIIQNQLVKTMGIPIPTFSEYLEKVNHGSRVKLFQLPQDKKYSLNLIEYAAFLKTENLSSALIINPGNPTGELFDLPELINFLNQMRSLELIVVDESFIDFSGKDTPSLIQHLERFNNLIVISSMSKHYGVPGLRLGYCCTSNPIFLQKIRSMLPVWNINTLSEYFLSILGEASFSYRESCKKVIEEVQQLYTDLHNIKGLEVYSTKSNFMLIKITFGMTARKMQMCLLKDYGIYVRDCSNKVGLDKYHIRVASKGRDKDKILAAALRDVIKEHS